MNRTGTPTRFRRPLVHLRQRTRDGSLAHRILTIAQERRPWYDWGARLMVLVGQFRTGSYDTPRGRDLWYRFEAENEHRGRIIKTRTYANVRATREQDFSWRIFDVQDDGHTVKVGHYGGQITHFGLSRREMKLFRRWDFWECRVRGEWFGLRRWLYHLGLHHHVDLRKPFACNATPKRGSGGYSHWHCELRGRHEVHRFRNYTWPGGTARVEYDPIPA
ncbi:hypothetical protein [Microbacterium enclense]|uniref:Uncharacterized protein n=1 Tax=Microbacterium enclense TaxID=993073 RepID=A0A1G6NTM9_9MICO|nr:hypothetical protein [Microbacterium enclense]KSU52886.1 hypothetical protein AS029_12825 [Microbacterium enclense]SDC71148.1 hypothetical protein SAMN05216418_2846 [Microbacterium enclense]